MTIETIPEWARGDRFGIDLPARSAGLRDGGPEFLTRAFHASGALPRDNRVTAITRLDEWNIGLGDSIVERMDEGLAGATYVVVCYSSSGVTSPWMGREWMSALARQLNGHGVKLLPVRLTGGNPPAILADIKYADLVKDWPKGLSELLRAIK